MNSEGPSSGNQKPYMPSPEEYLTSLPHGESTPPVIHEPRHEPRRRVRRHTRPIWPRFFLGLVILSLMAVAGYVGYLALIVAKVSTNPLALNGLAGDDTGRINILVLGIGDPGHAGEELSDTMMVISLDTHTNKVAQISIPRDLRVAIPGYGEGKINQANADGGVELAEQTVSNTLNIPIQYYLKTDFSGLKQLMDAVGGVDVNVKTRLVDTEYPCDTNQYQVCGLDIEPGQQHMDGARALQYVRCRKGTCGDDFGRAARQQEVIKLVSDKIDRWDVLMNPAKLTPVVQAVRSGIQTDMDAPQLAQLARYWQQAQKNQPVHFVPSLTNGLLVSTGSSDLVPADGDFSAIQDHVQHIFDAGQ